MKALTILIAATLGILAMASLQAAETMATRESHGDRLETLKENLDLTPEQIDQIRPILKKQREEIETLRAETSLSRDEKLDKCRSMIKSTAEEIRPILKPEQRERFGRAVDRMREAVEARIAARTGETRVQE